MRSGIGEVVVVFGAKCEDVERGTGASGTKSESKCVAKADRVAGMDGLDWKFAGYEVEPVAGRKLGESPHGSSSSSAKPSNCGGLLDDDGGPLERDDSPNERAVLGTEPK